MSYDKSLLKTIAAIYIGTVSFIFIFFGIVFGYFKSGDATSLMVFWLLLLVIYVTFLSAGMDLIKLYKPFIRRFILKHRVGIIDVSILIFVMISLVAGFFSYIYSPPLAWVLGVIIALIIRTPIIGIWNRRVWNPLKKKHKWLGKIESKGNNHSAKKRKRT